MTEKKGQIVSMGGGGFSMEPDNPLLDDFILSLAPRQPATTRHAFLRRIPVGSWF
jgi:hypothetical protein